MVVKVKKHYLCPVFLTSSKPIPMRKLSLLFASLLFGAVVYAVPMMINLKVGLDDYTPIVPQLPKSPVIPPDISYDGNVISFLGQHDSYTLCIYQDGALVYTVGVSSGTNTIVLPSWLEGQFEIRLLTGDSYYFYGFITL